MRGEVKWTPYPKSTNYLYKIQNEFIVSISKEIIENISNEIKEAKFYSIIADSTIDISKVDEFSIFLRYVLSNGKLVERFICFKELKDAGAESMYELITKTSRDLGLDIKLCRGQANKNKGWYPKCPLCILLCTSIEFSAFRHSGSYPKCWHVFWDIKKLIHVSDREFITVTYFSEIPTRMR